GGRRARAGGGGGERGVRRARALPLVEDLRADALAPGGAPPPLARLPEVVPAGELPHHHEIDALEPLRSQRGGADQRRYRPDRPQVGVDAEAPAQAEECLLGPHARLGIVPLRTADGAEQHRVGGPRAVELGGRQRLAGGVDGGAADHAGAEGEPDVVARHHGLEHGDGFPGHLGSDAIAREQRDGRLLSHGPTCASAWRHARRVSSLLSAFTYASALAWMMSVWLPWPVTVPPFALTRQLTSPCASVPPVLARTAQRSRRGLGPA